MILALCETFYLSSTDFWKTEQYFGEKNLKKYDLTSLMAEKVSPTLNSRRFGI